jgi:hypothetical protein
MGAREQLRVRVDDKLVLDAGTCEEVLSANEILRKVAFT